MKVECFTTSTYQKTIKINEFTLLTSEEFKKYKKLIPISFDDNWWLKDADIGVWVHYVNKANSVTSGGVDSNYGLRPVIKFEGDIPIGDSFYFNNISYIVIDNGLAIASRPIIKTMFDYCSNNYKKSLIKRKLDWLFIFCHEEG